MLSVTFSVRTLVRFLFYFFFPFPSVPDQLFVRESEWCGVSIVAECETVTPPCSQLFIPSSLTHLLYILISTTQPRCYWDARGRADLISWWEWHGNYIIVLNKLLNISLVTSYKPTLLSLYCTRNRQCLICCDNYNVFYYVYIIFNYPRIKVELKKKNFRTRHFYLFL